MFPPDFNPNPAINVGSRYWVCHHSSFCKLMKDPFKCPTTACRLRRLLGLGSILSGIVAILFLIFAIIAGIDTESDKPIESAGAGQLEMYENRHEGWIRARNHGIAWTAAGMTLFGFWIGIGRSKKRQNKPLHPTAGNVLV
jgi:hypothetical protein